MGRPALLVTNAGYGKTPLPADALLKPGDTPTARPLLITKPRHRSTLYVIEIGGQQVQVRQEKMLAGLTAACPDCLGTGRGSASDPEAKCGTCSGAGRRDVRGAT